MATCVIKYLIIVTMLLGNWYETQRSRRDFVVRACVDRPIPTMKTGNLLALAVKFHTLFRKYFIIYAAIFHWHNSIVTTI